MRRMRLRLRWKMLLFMVLAPVALAAGALWKVNRSVSEQVQTSLHEGLQRTVLVFENLLRERLEAQRIAAQVIARDPRFFSVLAVGASPTDAHYLRTVQGVARDFHRVAARDVMDVLDRNGRLLVSAGGWSTSEAGRARFVREARAGREATGILAEPNGHALVTAVPVRADGRIVGVLVIGTSIGERLARELKLLTHSDVTFVSGGHVTGTTLESAGAREALMREIGSLDAARGGGGPAVVHRLTDGGDVRLTLARPLPHAGEGGGQWYALQRSLDEESAFLRRIQAALGQLGLVAVVLAMVIGIILAERITRPILTLVRGAEEMERGNYDYPLNVRSVDEIGYLAERFQDMRQHERAYVHSLEEVARMKTEFIDVAAHELRTPITVIKGYHDLLSDGSLGPVTPKQQHALGAIEEGIVGLIRISENATRIAQLSGERLRLESAETTVLPMLEQAVDEALRDGPGRRVAVSVAVESGAEQAVLDGPRMVQAVAHLVRNGIRFTPDGGSVLVCARPAADAWIVEVRDTGIGMSEEELGRLFGRALIVRDALHHHSSSGLEFRSAGLGLGLSIVNGIVGAHGGKVDVQSAPGRGSVFTASIPQPRALALREAA